MESLEDDVKQLNKGVVELALAHGFFEPAAGGVQTEAEKMEKTEYWTAVDSFLNSVKSHRSEPVDIGDESILRRLRKTANYVKEYEETIADATNSAEGDVEEIEEEEEVMLGEVGGAVAVLPVPTVDGETEKLLRSSRALHRQVAGLRSFLESVLSDEAGGGCVDLPNCPEMEEPSVRQMLAPIRHIAEKREELKVHEEYPDAFLPDHILASLDKCVRMLSNKTNDQQC
ncbi:uncharacterized protein LOC126109846 isoform X2 [Schistocerca cancellata]|uniref:uncharacterized protein LOC126109846 isoform X2 n=1 Tax=Schistocerca cancellata TaxID=274614 RepID=UPI0021175CCC|nr:uncharacterized protein LOC126109846 isoform X2 [Schistocerca cancellata]